MSYRLVKGDCREVLAKLKANSVACCVTSPPYFGLRDYGHDGQIGLEETPEAYVAALVEVFREVRRVLRDDGTVWLNLGDSYGTGASGQNFDPATGSTNNGGQGATGTFGHKRQAPVRGFHKQLLGIPWRVAFALQADGWYLRQDIIWSKPNPMPDSVTDRCTKAHEYLFLLSKAARYYYDHEAVKEPAVGKNAPDGATRNRRSVWHVATAPYAGAHFATYPPRLIEPCILAGSRPGDIVLDPFTGSGTTGAVALVHGRHFAGIDLNEEYLTLAKARIDAALKKAGKAP